MLTGRNTRPNQAVNYFMEGYNHKVSSRWLGKGAEKLGLSGVINDKEIFTNIVNGRSPDGSQALYARKLDSSERLAATDFTFSAPKSVSLQALVGGDERLITAHSLAVQKTLELIESRYSFTRTTTDAGREPSRTGNLVIAEFDHIESRELDPHLHSHALIMNMTQLDDGKWQSLSNREIFKNKKFLGMIYQHHLAIEVQRLGYVVEPKQHGQFEIKGFREQDLEEFSKRRQQILNVVGSHSTWAEREGAWSITRKVKQKIDPNELNIKWQEEAEALGIKFLKPPLQTQLQPRVITEEHLEAAIAHCSERNVSFTQEDLEKFILNQGLATDISQIEPLIKANSELLSLSPEKRDFTTLTAINRELATIKLMKAGQTRVNPLAHPEIVESYLEKTSLNLDQRRAVYAAATTTDQFTAWQGVAGAGKTFALKQLKAITANSAYAIKAFAPSSAAAKVLSEELEVQGETVARLLVSELPQETEPHQIWVVDEAGLLSAKDALALLERATLEQARVLLVGDTRQLSAVEAGNPFKSLQQAGIKTSYLNESNRQRAPKLKLAVDLIASGRIEEGFNRLDESGFIETVSKESKIAAIANEYAAATAEQRARTLILAGTNFERLAITQAIREHLKAEGSLGKTIIANQLQVKDLTSIQKRYTHNFELGDMVMPTRSYKRRGLEKGQLYEVVGKDSDQITLKSSDGKHFQVDTGFDKAVYQCNEIEIAVGDRLRWTKNDRKLGRRNGQEFIVKSIIDSDIQIQYLDDGQIETFDLQQAQHLDYALVSTTYSSQGKTSDRVLISTDQTIGQESFYVAVSRARYELKLYTEDKEELLSLAQSSKAKENALALLRQKELEKQQSHQNYDNNQPQHSTTIGNNSKDRSDSNLSREVKHQNRTIRDSNPEFGANTSAKFDRIFGAISGYLELQEIERIAGIIGEINRDIIRSGLRGERAAQPTSDAQQFNTTIPSSPESNVPVREREKRPKLDNESVHDKALKAISEYTELSQVESSEIAQAVEQVIDQLKQLPTNQQPAYDKALKAISEYVELSQVESSEIAQAVGQVIEQLKQLPISQQPAYDKALKAISEYTELSQIESSEIAQTVGQVIGQLKQLPISKEADQLPAIASFIDSLSDKDLLYLEQIVNEYFSQAELPTPIDRPAIENHINNLKIQIDNLWMQHAQQEKVIKSMERLPLHELSKKYNSLVNQQLNTINTINKLFSQKRQLETSIQECEIQTQNYEVWAHKKETIEMEILSKTLQFPHIQKRLNTIIQKQQQKANIETKPYNTLRPSKSIRLRR